MLIVRKANPQQHLITWPMQYTVLCCGPLYRFQWVNVDVFHSCRFISLFAVGWSAVMSAIVGDLTVRGVCNRWGLGRLELFA